MPYQNKILKGIYRPLKFANSVGQIFGLAPSNTLRVLNYHDIPKEELSHFANQIRWLSMNYRFVTPTQFENMMMGIEPIMGHNLLLTFDDGFLSNRDVAEKVLNPMNISALFFIIYDFVEINDPELSRAFNSKNIHYNIQTESIPENWLNMGWKDIEALLEQGHTIGSHTMKHTQLSLIKSELELKKEISESADKLSIRLGVPINHFAYPFGNIESFSQEALAVAKQRFQFIYSGLRGDNVNNVSCFTIRRDAAASQNSTNNCYEVFSNQLLGSFLEGAADFHYSAFRKKLDKWDMNTNYFKVDKFNIKT